MRNGRAILSAAALCAVVGCFDEPVPAYTQVAPETRVYLKEKGLATLTPEAVYAQGLVFVDAAELLAQKDIDGGLIGGAALKADSFAGIIAAAAAAQ